MKNFFLFLPLLFFACKAPIITDITKLPNLEIDNLEYFKIEDGLKTLKVNAKKSYTFNESKKQFLKNVIFTTYEDGKVESIGNANEAKIDLTSSDVEVKGKIKVRSEKENATINTEYIYFSQKNRLVSGKKDVFAVVSQNGDVMKGRDLEFNLRNRTLFFKEKVDVQITEKENKEDDKKIDESKN